MILLNKPLAPNLSELNAWLNKVHDKHWYSNFGPLHDELTSRLEDYLGVKNLLLVNNGTSGLQVAGKVLHAKHIVTTPFSYVATSSAFLWQGQTLEYSDIDRNSLNMCPKLLFKALKNNPNIDTIVATHVYGNPCDTAAYSELAERFKKRVIFDAAHAFGVRVNNESVLKYGDASVLSFHATKLFHTVEGGAIVFKHAKDCQLAKSMITCGYEGGELVGLGINAKLNEYQAAVGLVNLSIIDDVIEHRQLLFEQYRSALNGVFEMPDWLKGASKNGAYMPVLCASAEQLNKVKKCLSEQNIGAREYFSPSLDTIFKPEQIMHESRNAAQRVLCLPLHFYLTKQDVAHICKVLKRCVL